MLEVHRQGGKVGFVFVQDDRVDRGVGAVDFDGGDRGAQAPVGLVQQAAFVDAQGQRQPPPRPEDVAGEFLFVGTCLTEPYTVRIAFEPCGDGRERRRRFHDIDLAFVRHVFDKPAEPEFLCVGRHFVTPAASAIISQKTSGFSTCALWPSPGRTCACGPSVCRSASVTMRSCSPAARTTGVRAAR